ncbi:MULTISPECIES: hypothetical protein [Rhizobium]|uniref:hypothetical protein n=1 Tax=Rhizobium TaxID=379 RepID=UPI0011325AA6|nr:MULTISPECIES: hypothetical protein [Rhizobium]
MKQFHALRITYAEGFSGMHNRRFGRISQNGLSLAIISCIFAPDFTVHTSRLEGIFRLMRQFKVMECLSDTRRSSSNSNGRLNAGILDFSGQALAPD